MCGAMKAKKPIVQCSYICGNCARKAGGRWERGHVATMHTGECPYCGQRRPLVAVSDYHWKRGSGLHYVWD